MPLNKTKLIKMIKKREEKLQRYTKELEALKDKKNWREKEKNKDRLKDKSEEDIEGYYKIDTCSISIAQFSDEIEIELLNKILNKYYQPKQRKPRKPSKFEQAKERLQQLEKQYNEGSIIIKTDLQWEIDNLRSFISGIEQMERAEKALKEEQEIVE